MRKLVLSSLFALSVIATAGCKEPDPYAYETHIENIRNASAKGIGFTGMKDLVKTVITLPDNGPRLDEFVTKVIPVFEAEWDAAPEHQLNMLEMLRDISRPEGAALWSKLPRWLTGAADPIIEPAMRVAPAIAGGILGQAAIPIPIVGAMIGGAAGSGLGELGAEASEVQRGARENLNPTQIGVQTVVGGVPIVGKAGQLAKTAISRGVQGGLLGGGGAAATDLAEGRDVDWKNVAIGTGVGTVLGGAGGALEAKLARGAKAASDVPVPRVKDAWDAIPNAPKPPTDDAGRALGGYAGPERRSAAR